MTEMKQDKFILNQICDDDLIRLNNILPWKCFTVDSKGRKLGKEAWAGKRSDPQVIPDERITKLNSILKLQDKTVLEIGCFEGVHTLGLGMYGAKVTAIDSRIENVVKTIVRCGMYSFAPTCYVCNVEDEADFQNLPTFDVIHHVGVLYHLRDPIDHLLKIKSKARNGLLLDTHYATSEMLNGEYNSNGKTYKYYRHDEGGRDEVFSGMHDHAKWILLQDIIDLLLATGFEKFSIEKNELQRNGPRACIYFQ